MSKNCEASIFVKDAGHYPSKDHLWVLDWLVRNKSSVVVVAYATGGWEHIWDVSGDEAVIAEVPAHLLSSTLLDTNYKQKSSSSLTSVKPRS